METGSTNPVEVPIIEHLLDEIDDAIGNIRGKLATILTVEPSMKEPSEDESSKSILRRRLESTLINLNVLYSRIEL